MDVKDRRRFPRVEGHFQVDLLNTGDDPRISPFEAVIPGTALDVSRQGIRLQSDYQVAPGALVSAIVYFRGQGSIALCKVMWKREGDDGKFVYGLFINEWTQMDPILEKLLDEADRAENQQRADPGTPGLAHAIPA